MIECRTSLSVNATVVSKFKIFAALYLIRTQSIDRSKLTVQLYGVLISSFAQAWQHHWQQYRQVHVSFDCYIATESSAIAIRAQRYITLSPTQQMRHHTEKPLSTISIHLR